MFRQAVVTAVLLLAVAGCAAMAAPNHAGKVQGGRVVLSSFHSNALNGTEHYAVFLPDGYASSKRRYPVVYALHGLPSDANGYLRMGIDAWGRSAQKAGHPAIIVSAQGARADDTDPEWHNWGPGRDWETAVAVELVQHIDRTYRAIPSRRGRALIGLSAGGYGATLIGFHHPGTFSVIQSWSGYFHPTTPDGNNALDVGSPEENAASSAHTYVPVMRRIYQNHHPMFFAFYVGDEDSRFLAENEQLHRELLAAHVPHTYAVYPGGHTGPFWTSHEDTWIGDAVQELAHR